MKQKLRKSDRLPKYGTTLRDLLVFGVAAFPGYREGLKKGFPLFTIEELSEIKEQYKDGLTWEDIDHLLSRKGVFFKKATFRKYIQEGNISKAIGYRNTENGRVAVFPSDTIAHINFIQYYYKIMDGSDFDSLIKSLIEQQISYHDAIVSKLTWSDNLHASIFRYICFGDADIETAIEKALKRRPNDREKYLERVRDIYGKFQDTIEKDVDEFVSQLQGEFITAFETIDVDQEGTNEQN